MRCSEDVFFVVSGLCSGDKMNLIRDFVIVVADGMSTVRTAKVSGRRDRRRQREHEGVENSFVVADKDGTDVDCGVQ